MPDTQDSLRHYYEEYYGRRGQSRTSRNLARVRSNLRGLRIAAGDRVLDIGCGSGTTGLYLAEQGATPVGFDISFEACRAAFESGGYLSTSQANAELLPLADLSADAAVFMGTLEHFIHPERALREAIRVLKPEAQLCFVVPNSNFVLFRLFGGTGQPHEVPRTCEDWHELFETAGLRIKMVYRDIGPGVLDGGRLLRGWMRRLVLFFSNLLPLRYTYQFVFICLLPAEELEHAGSEVLVSNKD